MSRDARGFRRARLQAEAERRHIARTSARERARERAYPTTRASLRARFIVAAATEANVRIDIIGSAVGADVQVFALDAPDLEHKVACEAFFRAAVLRNLPEIIMLAPAPPDGGQR